jgi:hypothetical protein
MPRSRKRGSILSTITTPIHVHGVVLNSLSTGTTLPVYLFTYDDKKAPANFPRKSVDLHEKFSSVFFIPIVGNVFLSAHHVDKITRNTSRKHDVVWNQLTNSLIVIFTAWDRERFMLHFNPFNSSEAVQFGSDLSLSG